MSDSVLFEIGKSAIFLMLGIVVLVRYVRESKGNDSLLMAAAVSVLLVAHFPALLISLAVNEISKIHGSVFMFSLIAISSVLITLVFVYKNRISRVISTSTNRRINIIALIVSCLIIMLMIFKE